MTPKMFLSFKMSHSRASLEFSDNFLPNLLQNFDSIPTSPFRGSRHNAPRYDKEGVFSARKVEETVHQKRFYTSSMRVELFVFQVVFSKHQVALSEVLRCNTSCHLYVILEKFQFFQIRFGTIISKLDAF